MTLNGAFVITVGVQFVRTEATTRLFVLVQKLVTTVLPAFVVKVRFGTTTVGCPMKIEPQETVALVTVTWLFEVPPEEPIRKLLWMLMVLRFPEPPRAT